MYLQKIPEFQDNIESIINKQNIINTGLQNHIYGIEMEKKIAEFLLNKNGNQILNMMNIESIDIKKIVYGKNISNYTKNNKIDILIITKDKQIGISCKASKTNMVGVLEMKGCTFYNKINLFLNENNLNCLESNKSFFQFFNENNCSKLNSQKKDIERCNSFILNIENDWKKFLKFCIQGENIQPKVEYLAFYDKQYKYLYVSNINEYISLVNDYGTLGTFHTRMSLTRTSGNSEKRIKFKMQNPIRILLKNKIYIHKN